jgi:hypothetical protein
MSSRGLVMFHDIAVQKKDFGVKKLWYELKEKYPYYLEFNHNYGMGLMYVGSDSLPYKFLRTGTFAHWITHRLISKSGLKIAVMHKQNGIK